MKWSLRIGRFAGIDVFVHWTFILLLGWIFFSEIGAGGDVRVALGVVGFVLALFGCVVLHEFGHALTARRYGIHTRDITLLPIGGLARLERMPQDPWHELWIALAGPAVNVAIAVILFAALLARGALPSEPSVLAGGFAARLMGVNVILAVFNLLPAFPMDGGRVLRALLATRLGRRRATQIASNVGQVLAILLGAFGFFFTHNPFLIFIAIFVYLGAQAEAGMVELTSIISGLAVRDAMQTRFRVLEAHDSLAVAVDELLAGSQQDFPVMEDGAVLGLLRRQDLIRALSERGRNSSVGEAMFGGCGTVEAGASLERAFERLQESGCAVAPVLDNGKLVGVLTQENISELVMMRNALEKRSAAAVSGTA